MLGVSVLSRRPVEPRGTRARGREEILDAAVALLDTGVAFAELTVGAITGQAGVSRPTFYAYFRDKRDLILALGEDFERRVYAAADSWLRIQDDDVAKVLDSVLGVFRDQRATLRAIVEGASYDREVAEFWRRLNQHFIDSVTERSQRADPTLSNEDREAQAFALVWMTERAFTEHLEAPRVSDQALLGALVGLWRSATNPD